MEELENSRPKKKIIDYLDSLSSATSTANNSTDVDIRFLWQPIEIVKDKNDSVKGISLERTELQGSPFRQIAVGTGEKQIFPCDLVITSLGYLNSPLEKLPFDRTQLVVPNHKGKVTADLHTGLTGVYVSGWLKRGAQVIHSFILISFQI
jgi:NADPH-dependent glutamate synthase beta subunit-like oxidoreductase